VGAFSASMAPAASTALVTWAPQWRGSASDSSCRPFAQWLRARESGRKNGRGRRRATEKRAPIVRRAIRGDQRRARFMSRHEDLEQIFSRARAEFLHAEILEDQQVDACQLLDEVAMSAGRFGLGEIRREVKRAAEERASAGANRADSEGRDRRQRARHSATRAARKAAV
jgi:hypothetical protein